MNWSVALQAMIFVSGVGGQLLVGRFDRRGFALWLGSNALLLGSSLAQGLYGIAALYAVYGALCARSWIQWSPGRLPAGAQGTSTPATQPAAPPPAPISPAAPASRPDPARSGPRLSRSNPAPLRGRQALRARGGRFKRRLGADARPR